MNKKKERDNFWINVGPESGYLGTIAEETARKNDGGISPDGKRLGWTNACDSTEKETPAPRQIEEEPRKTVYPCCDTTCKCDRFIQDNSASGGVTLGYVPIFGANCDCSTLPLPGMVPLDPFDSIPPADFGPEWQNTCE